MSETAVNAVMPMLPIKERNVNYHHCNPYFIYVHGEETGEFVDTASRSIYLFCLSACDAGQFVKSTK